MSYLNELCGIILLFKYCYSLKILKEFERIYDKDKSKLVIMGYWYLYL